MKPVPGLFGTVEVRTSGGGRYPVLVGAGTVSRLSKLLHERAPAHRYALIGDETVVGLHGERVVSALSGAGLVAEPFAFPPGEREKSRARWADLTDRLLAAGFGRDACILALGGGVTGDLAGFVAATYMRGIPIVQIPTSLVAMIDASVGGKTGVDLPAGKNLVGAFHPPRAVVADPELAVTLSPAGRAQGLVEALKHGAIHDAGYFERVRDDAEALLAGDVEATAHAVLRSVEIKADVVSRDEREASLREALNFGHTVGHGLEAASGYTLPHGTAVGVGMVLEARLGEALGVTRSGTEGAIASGLRALGMPASVAELGAAAPDPAAAFGAMRADKKVRSGVIRVVLLREVGAVDGTDGGARPVPESTIRAVLEGG